MIKIIPMDKDNAHFVSEIESKFFNNAWDTDRLINTLKNNNIKYFIASYEDTVCGYVGVLNTIDQLEIINIATERCFQNKGVASALLCKIEEYANELDIPRIELEVRESNIAAKTLYEKNKYTFVRLDKNYYHRPTEDACIYEKTLGDKHKC